MNKQLFIIAGANGSGKSTLASELLPEEKLEFLNADDIAKEICPENIESVKISAGKEVYKRLNLFFENNVSFAVETTLSGSNYIKTINKAKELNYNVTLIYTFLKSPETCIERIRVRVRTGGHHVPDQDVIRRYYRSKKNLWFKYKDIVDEWTVFYNGSEGYLNVMEGDSEGIEIFNEELYNLFMENIK